MRKLGAVLTLLAVALGAAWWFKLVTWEHHAGYFGPAAPGEEIDKAMGKYIVHDHYHNSRKLNAHLAGGAREFLVRYRGETYRLEIRHAR